MIPIKNGRIWGFEAFGGYTGQEILSSHTRCRREDMHTRRKNRLLLFARTGLRKEAVRAGAATACGMSGPQDAFQPGKPVESRAGSMVWTKGEHRPDSMCRKGRMFQMRGPVLCGMGKNRATVRRHGVLPVRHVTAVRWNTASAAEALHADSVREVVDS